MSIPPQVIKVKRKRDDDAPVTFLRFDDGVKRHRSDSNWAYQRRETPPKSPVFVNPRDARPVIQVAGDTPKPKHKSTADVAINPTRAPSAPVDQLRPADAENGQKPARRFHISRAMLKSQPTSNQDIRITKRKKHGPAIFVEHTRRKLAAQRSFEQRSVNKQLSGTSTPESSEQTLAQVQKDADIKPLKKPGVAVKKVDKSNTSSPAPLPTLNRHEEDMSKITADMDAWVMNEIGANLDAMDQEMKAAPSPSRFRPKAPAQRYRDRHPDAAPISNKAQSGKSMDVDSNMTDVSDEEGDGDDWIIEEYVRIPAKSMAGNVLPTDVGVIVLDGEEATALFYGPDNDSDDEYAEDDEDENAENYYAADYPEDEVDSDDEFGRQAYLYRTKNASDDEEFDNEGYESSDDMVLDDGGDDDATMARIKAYVRRHAPN